MPAVRFSRTTDPVYYHREYKNDVDKPADENSWAGTCHRVGIVALPFLSLYKPASFPLSLALGGLRTWTCITHFFASLERGGSIEIGHALLQTVISIIAVAGTIFAHPLGMLITTGQDLVVELGRLIRNLNDGEYQKAMESCLSIVNNALYLALFLYGGLELSMASFAMQVLIGLYHSHSEFKRGHYLEAAGHLGMALIRAHQLKEGIQLSIPKLTDEELMAKAKATGNQELIDVLNRYHKQGNFEPAIYNSLEKGDWAAAEMLIKNHAKVEYEAHTPGGYVPPVLALALRIDNVPASLFEQLIKNGGATNFYAGVITAGDNGRFDLMELLLRYGADPNAHFRFQWIDKTPLRYFIERVPPRTDAIALLLKYKADPNRDRAFLFATVCAGNPSINQQAKPEMVRMIKLFLENGGDMHQMSQWGAWDSWYKISPYQLAQGYRVVFPELLKVFEDYRAWRPWIG